MKKEPKHILYIESIQILVCDTKLFAEKGNKQLNRDNKFHYKQHNWMNTRGEKVNTALNTQRKVMASDDGVELTLLIHTWQVMNSRFRKCWSCFSQKSHHNMRACWTPRKLWEQLFVQSFYLNISHPLLISSFAMARESCRFVCIMEQWRWSLLHRLSFQIDR